MIPIWNCSRSCCFPPVASACAANGSYPPAVPPPCRMTGNNSKPSSAASPTISDGVTLRQPLCDALDLIAEELEVMAGEQGAAGLNRALFESGRFSANTGEEDDPDNYDLAHVLAGNPSNAVGLGIIFLLIANRLGIDVDGLLLPRSLLCRYHEEGEVILSEPLVKGRRVLPDDLAHRMRRYPRDVRMIATRAATPGELLVRVVEELATAWSVRGETEDAELMEELLATLVKAPF
jgi:regulator of sirC expression with transglutaminase-like and TPR domain